MSVSKVTVVSQVNYPLTLSSGRSLTTGEVAKVDLDDTVQRYIDEGFVVVVPDTPADKPATKPVSTPASDAKSTSESQEK
jgi:hypothetical protein